MFKKFLSIILTVITLLSIIPIASAAILPTTYDARDKGVVTSIKDYGKYPRSDFAFATISALESSLISQGYADKTLDLSEAHIAYKTDYKPVPVKTDGYIFNLPVEDYSYKETEYPLDVAFEVATREFLVDEKEYPYDLDGTDDMKLSGFDSTDYKLESWTLLGSTNEIKNAIMSQGSVVTSIRFNQDNIQKISKDHYSMTNVDKALDKNHSVAIIGWNSKEWLVKDSMGTNIGLNGYYYIPIAETSDYEFFEVVAKKSTIPSELSTRVVYSSATVRNSGVYEFDSNIGYVGAHYSQATNSADFIESVSFYFSENSPYKITATLYSEIYKDTATSVLKLPLTNGKKLISKEILTEKEGFYTISFFDNNNDIIKSCRADGTILGGVNDDVAYYSVVLKIENLNGDNAKFPVEDSRKENTNQDFVYSSSTLCSKNGVNWEPASATGSLYDFPILVNSFAETAPESLEIVEFPETITFNGNELDLSKIKAKFNFDNIYGKYSINVPASVISVKNFYATKVGVQEITVIAKYLFDSEIIKYTQKIKVNTLSQSDIFNTQESVIKNKYDSNHKLYYFDDVKPGTTILDGLLSLKENVTYKLHSSPLKTGDTVTLYKNNIKLTDYTVLIYGDINKDGWYDKKDAAIINDYISGKISYTDLDPIAYKAADVNRDLKVNEKDYEILMEADSLLNSVNKQNPSETQDAFNAYIQVIDNSKVSTTKTLLERIIDFFLSVFEVLFGISIR